MQPLVKCSNLSGEDFNVVTLCLKPDWHAKRGTKAITGTEGLIGVRKKARTN